MYPIGFVLYLTGETLHAFSLYLTFNLYVPTSCNVVFRILQCFNVFMYI